MGRSNNTISVGDWVEVVKRVGDWCVGDQSKVVYVSGDFIDVEDAFGGKRRKKGRDGLERR